MAVRYSGGLTVRMRWINDGGNGTYRCVVSSGEDRAVVFVRHEAHIVRAVDSPESYDSAARAAIAFAEHDEDSDRSSDRFSRFADYDDAGIVVARKRA